MKNAANVLSSWLQNYKLNFKKYDASLVVTVVALVTAGLIMNYSSSYIYALEHYKDGLYFFKRHLFYVFLASVALLAGWIIPLESIARHTKVIFASTVALLALTLIPGIAHKAGGASRWIQLGLFSIQPAEIIKVSAILFLAFQMNRKQYLSPNWRSSFATFFLPCIPVFAILLLQPDFGSVVILTLTITLVLIGRGVKTRYLFTLTALAIPIGAYLVISSPYRRARLESFLNPWNDAAGKGFQVIQSMVAVYSGQFFGVGLGNSKEKLFYLPEAHNDFIFAVIGEELGLVGMSAFVALFLFIILKGLNNAQNESNTFRQSVGMGISCLLGLQAFFNIAVVVGLLPTKGLTLPFLSYGGTALICTLFMMGLLIQLSGKRSS